MEDALSTYAYPNGIAGPAPERAPGDDAADYKCRFLYINIKKHLFQYEYLRFMGSYTTLPLACLSGNIAMLPDISYRILAI